MFTAESSIIDQPTHAASDPLGRALRHARKSMRMSGEALAAETGLSRRTIVKIEQGDETVAFGSYRRVARELHLDWLFDVFTSEADAGYPVIPKYYLSGTTALSLPQQNGGAPALWYSSSLANPKSWRIAGKNLSSTNGFLGVAGLWDATEMLRRYGVEVPRIWAATPERAVFDLLIHHCEVKGKVVPNIQASDVDDVVNLMKVSEWLEQCEAFLSVRGKKKIMTWMEGGY